MEDRDYWLWLTGVKGFGNRRVKSILDKGLSPKDLFDMERKELDELLREMRVKSETIRDLIESRVEDKLEAYVKKLRAQGISYLTPVDEDFPDRLYGLHDPVNLLFYRGDFKQHHLNIAMVGSRQCTAYGRKVAERLAQDLAENGVNVISGMAAGIDGHSHAGALKGNGYTTAVLGSGINVCYPPSHQELMRQIVQNGCVLSEYGLNVQPSRITFPLRNRIIAALCDGIILIEAKERSGSLITIDYALDYGKDVFAVPGDVLGRTNAGSNNIIRLGGKPVFEVKDVLEEYSMFSKNGGNSKDEIEMALEEKEKMVYSGISLSPVHVDELSLTTGLAMNELQYLLTKLEIKGAVIQLPNKYYIRDY